MITLHIDLRSSQHPDYRIRGIGQMTRSLLRQAPNFAPDELDVIGIVDPALPALLAEDRALVSGTIDCAKAPPRTTIFVQPSPMTLKQQAVLRFLRDRSITKAAVVYDFIPHDLPSRYFQADGPRIGYSNALFYLRAYDCYFPISDYSAKRLVELTGVAANRVHTIGAPVREELIAVPPAAPDASGTPYFLTVAGDDWRKNVECPVAAFARLAGAGRDNLALTIVGSYSSARRAQILAPHPSALRRRVRFRDGLSDAELAALYAGAVATICPSRIEGFSLPVVEALTCGSPVLAADCAAQVELVPDPEALFAPDDIDRAANLMAGLLDNPSRRATLLASQQPVATRFTEREVAGKFWRTIFASHEQKARAAPSLIRGIRPRLAFVSPYPPDQSGVADYTARSLIDIAPYADIDLFTDAAARDVSRNVRVAGPISSFPYFSRRYDRVVSVVGNSHFHDRIVSYVRDFGGACIEHDARLANLYLGIRGFESFARLAEWSLGRPVSRAEAESGLLTPEVFKSLFFDDIVHAAFPFIVHTRGIAHNVKAQYGIDPVCLPFSLYRTFSDKELSDTNRAAARDRLGIAPHEIAIASFGMPAPSKCNAQAIEALALLRSRGVDATMYIVGEINGYVRELKKHARHKGVGKAVRFMSERPSEQTFRDFLLAADLGVQLRSYGLGEPSGALLDVIGAGMSAVATADLAVATEAPPYIRTVPLGAGVPAIADVIAAVLAAGQYRHRISAVRNDYCAAHTPARYARELMAALGFDIAGSGGG